MSTFQLRTADVWKRLPFHPATPGYQHHKDTIQCNPKITSRLRVGELQTRGGSCKTSANVLAWCARARASASERAAEAMMAAGGAQRLTES